MSDSVWPHRRQPTRLPRPWDSPGKNTGVSCHFLLQCMNGKWKWSPSVVSDSQRPYGLQPSRLLHPWDFPGKSTRVGCHCLLLIMHIPGLCSRPFDSESLDLRVGFYPSDSQVHLGLRTTKWFRTYPMAQWVKNLPVMQETQEMQVQSLGWEDSLKEEMATHSSILAWRIPWTEEPSRL